MKAINQVSLAVAALALFSTLVGCGGGGGGGDGDGHPLAPPSVTVTATPSTIAAGESSALHWESRNATGVVESNFGATEVSGTTGVSPTVTTTYSITVAGDRGQATQSITVTVGEPGAPGVSLTADPSTINVGESTTLQWSSTNAEVVMESNFGATTLSGTVQVSPAATTTYYIAVRGAVGWARQECTVTVIPLSSPPRASFTVTPYSGDTTTLFQFDASGCNDDQDPTSALEIRWDWEDDGTYDTDYTTIKTASHRYASTGTWTIRLEVRDTEGLTDATTRWVIVTAGGAISRIAFVSDRDGGRGEIYVMNSDGTNQTRLTNNPAGDGCPCWSPDGSKIAFVSDRDGNEEIYVMDWDGANQTNLTNNPAGDGDPSWSPDGRKIAFVSWRTGNTEIHVMNADGTNWLDLTSSWWRGGKDGPCWSPDGGKIAFFARPDVGPGPEAQGIYVMNSDGTNPTLISTHYPAFDMQPSWSPDGSKIAFTSDREGAQEAFLGDIYVMNSDGSNQTNLTTDSFGGSNSEPCWSPDGTKIAFTFFYLDIYVMNSDGTNPINVSNDPWQAYSPSWSPF